MKGITLAILRRAKIHWWIVYEWEKNKKESRMIPRWILKTSFGTYYTEMSFRWQSWGVELGAGYKSIDFTRGVWSWTIDLPVQRWNLKSWNYKHLLGGVRVEKMRPKGWKRQISEVKVNTENQQRRPRHVALEGYPETVTVLKPCFESGSRRNTANKNWKFFFWKHSIF